ncbi:hypothetical protein HMPREF9135_0374 [Segatella baroniae F0067]|uniref:Uncharacterized protein n=1 Tax=Segatella baroniae F0067 TaxID=1115809 RepID=U2QM08_9BACT|nr:hypothetical protein HMPREF9135_0374 [Segatella baroniae F0067]
MPLHASKAIDNPDGSPVTPDNSHHKRKKTKAFGLDISIAGQTG